MKRTISLILSLLMVVGLFAVVPFGAVENDTVEVGAEPDLAGTSGLSQDGKYVYSKLDDGTIEITAHRYFKDNSGGTAYLKIPSKIDGHTVSSIAQNAFAYTQRRLFFIPSTVSKWYTTGWNTYSQTKPIIVYERVTPDSHHEEGSNIYPAYEYHLLGNGTACLDVIRPQGDQTIVPDTLWNGTKVSMIYPQAFQSIPRVQNYAAYTFNSLKIEPAFSYFEPFADIQEKSSFFYGYDGRWLEINVKSDAYLHPNDLLFCRAQIIRMFIVGSEDVKDNFHPNGAHRLEIVDVKGEIKNIGQGAFTRTPIENIFIRGNVENIGANAFSFTSAKSLQLDDGVKTIGEKAFYRCDFKEVTIPASVMSIGDLAFGYAFNSSTEQIEKMTGFTIYGVRGTAAEQYANENHFKFIPIEPSTVNGLEITLTEPEPGEKPDYNAVVPEGRGYAVDSEGGVMWFNVTDGDAYIDPNSDYTFEPYKEYRAMITLVTTDDDYHFAATNRRAELNGMDVGFSDYGWSEEHMVYVESYYVCAPEGGMAIREVEVEMDEPAVGDMPYYYALTDSELYRVTDAEDDDDRYISGGIGWYNETDSRDMAYTERFEEGKTYQWSIRLTSTGCSFAPADEINATVNGKAARIKRLSDRTVELWVYYAMPGQLSGGILGDVDNDEKVTIFDASSIQKSLAHMKGYADYATLSADDAAFLAADVDGDKKVTIFDASVIQKWLAKVASAQGYGIGDPI